MPPKVKQMIKEQEEQKVLKEFEELGYEYEKIFCIQIINEKKGTEIYLTEECKGYIVKGHLNMQEHQLLHKLFELWGWLE